MSLGFFRGYAPLKKKRRCLLERPGTKTLAKNGVLEESVRFTATESKRFFGAHMSKGYG